MVVNDVTIVGAGPYGLSAAAHLRKLLGLELRVFGEPMEFWERNMPAGMFLRSSWEASHIASPGSQLTLEAYAAARGNHIGNPIPIARFVDYGKWFQQQAVKEVDRRKIQLIEPKENIFHLKTDDGEVVKSKFVVIATGIGAFARMPDEFGTLPRSLVSHSSQHTSFDHFRGKRVLVVGGGQSALESGALLHETGANVEIVARQPGIHWLRWRGRITRNTILGRLIYSPRDVGPPGISQLVARPDYLRYLPRKSLDWIGKRSIRPAGAGWLIKRLKDVSIRANTRVTAVEQANGKLRVRTSDGIETIVDHLHCATGYRIDVANHKFFGREILSRLDVYNGFPQLRAGLESSVPGLYFLGAPAAWTFGPVARFVSGAHYCAPAAAKNISEKLR